MKIGTWPRQRGHGTRYTYIRCALASSERWKVIGRQCTTLNSPHPNPLRAPTEGWSGEETFRGPHPNPLRAPTEGWSGEGTFRGPHPDPLPKGEGILLHEISGGILYSHMEWARLTAGGTKIISGIQAARAGLMMELAPSCCRLITVTRNTVVMPMHMPMARKTL